VQSYNENHPHHIFYRANNTIDGRLIQVGLMEPKPPEAYPVMQTVRQYSKRVNLPPLLPATAIYRLIHEKRLQRVKIGKSLYINTVMLKKMLDTGEGKLWKQ
jgi:hypothetical protein